MDGPPAGNRRFLRQLRVRLLSAGSDPPLGGGPPAERELSGQPRDAQGLFRRGDGHGPRHRADHRQAGGTGLRENTLVVFTSDNGFSCGHHGFWGKGNGTYPPNMYENSIKVPFVISHPARIPAESVQDGIVSAYDFMPTLLDYLGLPLPENLDLPGQSALPLLLGEDDTGRQEVVIYDEYGATRMMRTEEWKYVHRYPEGPHELYDLANDPDERTNLAGDPSQAERIGDLKQRLEEWYERYVVPDRDGRNFAVTGKGQLRPVGRSMGRQLRLSKQPTFRAGVTKWPIR